MVELVTGVRSQAATVPGRQAKQLVLPVVLAKVPMGQGTQAGSPGTSVYVPMGQGMHEADPEGDVDPAGQSVVIERLAEVAMAPAGAGRQAVIPATGANVPSAQSTQGPVGLLASRYVPGGQLVYLSELAGETVPSGAGVQTVEPLNWAYELTPHGPQTVERVERADAVPGEQSVHALLPVVSEYDPGAHGRHIWPPGKGWK